MKKLFILLLILGTVVGCSANPKLQDASVLLEEFREDLSSKENVVFLSNTTIHRGELTATVNLKGVLFVETNQLYFIGNTAGHRLELYKNQSNSFIKNKENQWVSLDTGGAKELESFINNPIRLLEYAEFGNFEFLENTQRVNGRRHKVLSGTLNSTGKKNYLQKFLPELMDNNEEIFVELSLYIDASKGTLGRIDLFINEFSGEFSLVTEITITEFNVDTDIKGPK